MATILENVYALSAHLEDAYDALEAKGATIPATKNATNLSTTIDTVPAGGGYSATDLFNADLNLVFTGLTAIPNNPNSSNEQGKFCRWTNIKSVSFPDLVSVGTYGCQSMFSNSSSLTSALALPATAIASNCYRYMFYWCPSLMTAPTTLPATTLYSNCYNCMFFNCISLTTAPALPAATLASNCYYAMFSGCTSLAGTITLPVLNTNTSIPLNAFQNMFQNCPPLTKVILDFSTFESIPTLGGTNYINVFNNTTDARFEIHVPSALADSWKTASNWSTWASHIVGV